MPHKHTKREELRENVHVFYIGFDIDDNGDPYQEKKEFGNELFLDILSFAFGPDRVMNQATDSQAMMAMVEQAMKKLYEIPSVKEASEFYTAQDEQTRVAKERALRKNPDTEKTGEEIYTNRGEFGELMLYHWLHEYFDADALISKIYFKDSVNLPAHGFDAVHVNKETKTLWLGESKLYKSDSAAISALTKDLDEHFNRDFFHSEFTIISGHAKSDGFIKDPFIINLLDPETKVLDRLANINVALFAGFESKTIKEGFCDDFVEKLKNETEALVKKANEKFIQHPWIQKNQLNWYLFLFPYEDKNELVKSLHLKLKGRQQ